MGECMQSDGTNHEERAPRLVDRVAEEARRAASWILTEATGSHASPSEGTPRGSRVPPAVWGAAAFGSQIALGARRPVTRKRIAGAAAFGAGSAWLMAGSVLQFYRQRTTIDPINLQPASLVDTGPNRVTRNPMYLGISGLLAGHAVLRGGKALLPAAAFVLVIDRLQVRPEEAALRQSLGAEYEQYRERTPRWLGTRSLTAVRGRQKG